jgi:hypothetical protein
MNMNLGFTQLIVEECRKFGCLRNQAAYILATAYHETAHTMRPVVEAYWLSEAWRKKNLRYYPYHGRGFVQLTWKANYVKAGKELGVDFVANPDQLLEPNNSAKILVKGSMEGWFTGKSIPDYITLQKSDFKGARRVINGTDKASQIANLAKRYDEILKAQGYGEEPLIAPDVKEVIVEPEGLDKPMHKSKTMWLDLLKGFTGSFMTFLSGLNPYIQALIILAIVGAVVWSILERKRYRDEARAIKAVL